MVLQALCHILKEYLLQNRNQIYDHREERVPCAIGNFFTAFVWKQMKEGLYSCLLSDLLASIEEVYSKVCAADKIFNQKFWLLSNCHSVFFFTLFQTSYAAELLASILEFWPCWKCPEIESVVTHIFTLEEYERISCSKCQKNAKLSRAKFLWNHHGCRFNQRSEGTLRLIPSFVFPNRNWYCHLISLLCVVWLYAVCFWEYKV